MLFQRLSYHTMAGGSNPATEVQVAAIDSVPTVSRPRRQLRRTNTESVAAQKLRDNFKGSKWDHNAIYVRTVNDETLWDRLRRDTHQSRHDPDAAITFGRDYYNELKALYAPADDPDAMLRSLNPSPRLPVGSALMQAMIATQKSVPDKSLMMAYLSTTKTAPNKTEAIGILRWAIGLNPLNVKHLPNCQDVARCAFRFNMPSLFPDAWACASKWFDDVLDASFSHARSTGMTLSNFLQIYESVAKLVLPAAPLKRVMAHKKDDDWTPLSDDIAELSATKGGATMFSPVASLIVAEEVSKICLEKAKGLLARRITESAVRDVKADIAELCGGLRNIGFLVQKREVKIAYGSIELKREVRNLTQQIDMTVNAVVRSCGVANGVIPDVFLEGLLHAEHDKAKGVDEDLLVAARSARTLLNQAVSDAAATSADMVTTLVYRRSASFRAVDAGFDVELAIVDGVCGEKAAINLKKETMATLPSEDSPILPEDSLQRIAKLVRSQVFQLAPLALQGKVQAVQKLISTVAEQRMLVFSEDYKKDTEFLADCVTRLQYFVSYKVKAVDGKEHVKYGTNALKAKLDDLISAHGDGNANANHCTPFIIFEYLLDSDSKEKARAITKDLLQGMNLEDATSNKRPRLGVVRASTSAASGSTQTPATDNASDKAVGFFD